MGCLASTFLQELTCLHFERRLLGAKRLRQASLSSPLQASVHLLRAAFAVNSHAVLDREDVLDEEGGQRFDHVRHFHLAIYKSEALRCWRAAAACLLAPSQPEDL